MTFSGSSLSDELSLELDELLASDKAFELIYPSLLVILRGKTLDFDDINFFGFWFPPLLRVLDGLN